MSSQGEETVGQQREGTLITVRAQRSRQGGHAEGTRKPDCLAGGGQGKGGRTDSGSRRFLLRSLGTSKGSGHL